MIILTDASDDKHYLADEIVNVNIKRKRTEIREGGAAGRGQRVTGQSGRDREGPPPESQDFATSSQHQEDVNSCSSDIVIENEGPLKR